MKRFPYKSTVLCIRKRLAWAKEIQDRLGSKLYLDLSGNPLEAFCGAIMSHGGQGHFHMEDDVMLSKNFEKNIIPVIKEHSDHVIRFFPGMKKNSPGQPVWRNGSDFLWHQCIWFPDWFNEGFNKWLLFNQKEKWTESEYRHYITRHDDATKRYLKESKVKFLDWYPVLVQHRLYHKLHSVYVLLL